MMRLFILKIVIVSLVVTSSNWGQDFSKTGTAAAQFLKIPVGAKAIGSANTFGSFANDPSVLYWNPAGIAFFNDFEVNFDHLNWIADIPHDFLGIVVPIDDKSSFGISAVSVNYGNMERTTVEKPKGTGTTFDAIDLAFSVSYARALLEQVSVGITIKYVTQRIWNESAQTAAFDFGTILTPGFYDMKVGLMLSNFGPDLSLAGSDLIRSYDIDKNSASNPLFDSKLTTQSFNLPIHYSASVAFSILGENAPIKSLNYNFSLALNAVHFNDNPEHYSVGAEYSFFRMFFLRGGYIFNTDEGGLNYGFGVKLDVGPTSFLFDYAYSDMGIFDGVNAFSIGLKL